MGGAEDNIFNIAGQQRPKKRPASPPKSAPTPPKKRLPPEKPPKITPPDPEEEKALQERYVAVGKLRDELDKATELVYGRTGLNKESIESFLDNPENFKELNFSQAQRDREILRGEIKKMAGEEVVEKIEKKKKKKALKKRARRARGGRRNWIDMR